jgi:DNA-binding beta-propeller fold protein YncE
MFTNTSKLSQARTCFFLTALLLSAAMVPALVVGQKKKANQRAPDKVPDLVWPLPPEKPRIRYLGGLSSNTDVEPPKKKGWMQKLINEEEAQHVTGLGRPTGIAVDSQERIYIADTGKGAVFIFDLRRKTLDLLGGGGRGRLANPYGIAIDKNDNVYVSDTRLKLIHVYDRGGTLVAAFNKVGNQEIVNPTGLAIDEKLNRLLIVDSRGHRVFAANLDHLDQGESFGKRGEDDDEFNFPGSVAVDGEGRIYVTDTLNFCVKVFDKDFKFIKKIGEHGTGFGMFDRPKGIALDSQGNIYVVDASFSIFQIFNQAGHLLLFVGGFGTEVGSFRLPSGIFIDKHDRIYVSDQINKRIQIFQFLGGS